MPHLTLPIMDGGPILTAIVHVSSPRYQALKASGQPVPEARSVLALIDTGASVTGFDPSVIQALGLPVASKTVIHTPNQQSYLANQYDAALMIAHKAHNLYIGNLPVVESDLAKSGIEVLIGRDVLKSCLLVYDGVIGQFSIAF